MPVTLALFVLVGFLWEQGSSLPLINLTCAACGLGLENLELSSEKITDVPLAIIEKKVIVDLEQFIDNFKELDVFKQLAVSLLLGDSVIISNLISITFIFFGDFLIKKFDLENKYPSLSNIIKLRRKFQRYYLIINIGLILFIVLVQIIFSVAVLNI